MMWPHHLSSQGFVRHGGHHSELQPSGLRDPWAAVQNHCDEDGVMSAAGVLGVLGRVVRNEEGGDEKASRASLRDERWDS